MRRISGGDKCVWAPNNNEPPEDTPQLCASSRRGAHGEDKASSWGGILVRTQGLLSALGSRLCSRATGLFAKKLVLSMFTSLHLPKLLLSACCPGSPEDTVHPVLLLANINNSLAHLIPSPSPSNFPLYLHPQGPPFVLFTIRRRGLANLVLILNGGPGMCHSPYELNPNDNCNHDHVYQSDPPLAVQWLRLSDSTAGSRFKPWSGN